jgi:hypothetical protein
LKICETVGEARLMTSADRVEIVAPLAAGDEPRTVRWGYVISALPQA